MSEKASPEENELYRRCDEVLHYLWDPIGVRSAPGARDEYRGYLPHVFKLVREEADTAELVQYLLSVQTERMGMEPTPEHAEYVISVLQEWRNWIAQHGTMPG